MTSSSVIDLEHLRSYTGGDPDVERDVFASFRQQCEMWGRMLDPTGDDEAWRSAAHALKGLARGIGAFAFAEACEAAEAVGGDAGTPVARSVALETLRTAMHEAVQAVSALERRAAADFRRNARAG